MEKKWKSSPLVLSPKCIRMMIYLGLPLLVLLGCNISNRQPLFAVTWLSYAYIVDLGKSHVSIAGSWGVFAYSHWLQPKGAHGWLRSSEYWWTFEQQGWDPRCRFVWGWCFLSIQPTYFAFIMSCMADIETNINQPKLANPNYALLSPNMPSTSSADRSRCPMLLVRAPWYRFIIEQSSQLRSWWYSSL